MSTKAKTWWKAAGIRATRTVAQTALGIIGTTVFLNEVDWLAVVSASVLAGILSLNRGHRNILYFRF